MADPDPMKAGQNREFLKGNFKMGHISEQEKINKKAREFIAKKGEQYAYDFTTWILQRLQGHGFCIWQTYTKDDVKLNEGEWPTDEHMQELADNLQSFENIRI